MSFRRKRFLYCVAGILCLVSGLSITVAVSANLWIHARALCVTGAKLVNASGEELEKFLADIRYGLFHGEKVRQCGLGGRPVHFSFFQDMWKVTPASIHLSVILFSAVQIVFALVATVFSMYNTFGKPFETLHGPTGLYLWNAISCSCGFIVLVLFSMEVKLHHLSEKIANYNEKKFIFKTHEENYEKSYWIIFICSSVHFLNILLIRLTGVRFPFQKSKESELSTITAVELMY
ncbi:clarin-1-like [Protopterus annectens]|uniref:clarin-1-like n=1 Tax=Protopterus annectens TaxID=7888 RepID=UPI001CFB1096|nr:clarin-1-like [Protopterus annectens]